MAAKDFERQQQLFGKNYISQAALERAESQFKAAQAQVAAQRAQAGATRTQSGFFVVRAPYAGIVSDVPISLGTLSRAKPVIQVRYASQRYHSRSGGSAGGASRYFST